MKRLNAKFILMTEEKIGYEDVLNGVGSLDSGPRPSLSEDKAGRLELAQLRRRNQEQEKEQEQNARFQELNILGNEILIEEDIRERIKRRGKKEVVIDENDLST